MKLKNQLKNTNLVFAQKHPKIAIEFFNFKIQLCR